MDTSTNQIIQMDHAPNWLVQFLSEHSDDLGAEEESEVETPYDLGFV
jgi:hypothetical protein